MQRGSRASIYALEIGIYARLRLFLWDLVGGARQRPHLAVLAAAPQHLVSGCFCCQMVLCWPIPFPPDLLGISSSAPLHEATKTQENTAHSTQATAHFVRMTVALRVRACREVETHTNHTRCRGCGHARRRERSRSPVSLYLHAQRRSSTESLAS